MPKPTEARGAPSALASLLDAAAHSSVTRWLAGLARALDGDETPAPAHRRQPGVRRRRGSPEPTDWEAVFGDDAV